MINRVIRIMKTGLTTEKLSAITAHNTYVPPPTQEAYYRQNGAPEEILKYVRLAGKTFGEGPMEKIAKEYFNLNKKLNSEHDHVKLGKKIEQKSCRYGCRGDVWKPEHIEMKHEWDYLLLCGLDFTAIRFFIATRQIIESLIERQIITGQGKKNKDGIAEAQQAYWLSGKKNYNIAMKEFTEIMDEDDLIEYIQKN